MYLIAIAWLYVALMMALAEASNPVGSVLGAVITFILYGLLPCALLMYILGTPERKRRLKRQREQELAAWQAAQLEKMEEPTQPDASAASDTPDGERHAPSMVPPSRIAPMGEKP